MVVALEADLADQPLAVQLLGQALVLWRGTHGQPLLFKDQCPHRGAQLSLGQVRGGVLQCAYHGLVWGSLGKPLHERPALHGLPKRRLVYGPFDVATSAPRAVENFLDTAHFAFVHRGYLGEASHPEVPLYEVVHTPDGRPVIERYQTWQPRAGASSVEGGWVNYRYEVLSPYSALLSKQALAGGPQDSYVIWACPSAEEHCRFWFAQYTSDEASSTDALRDFQVTIFSQDQPILESQRPKRLPLSGGEVMGAADRLSAAYRRYLTQCGVRFGVC